MLSEAHAVALAIAERKLNSLGWKWGPKDLGAYAAEILLEMDAKLTDARRLASRPEAER